MWELDCEESWVLKNWCFWTVVLEKTLESSLDSKEIQPVHSKGDQSWVFFGKNDAKAETPILWPPHAKSWFIGKDPDAGRDWRKEEKGTVEDEMAGWHHWFDGHEFEWTLGVRDGQGGLTCFDSWARKESDTTEQLNWTELTEYLFTSIVIYASTLLNSLLTKLAQFSIAVSQWVKNPPAMQETQETQVWSLGRENPLKEGMATHSSILAWRIPWAESIRLQWVIHDWTDWVHTHLFFQRPFKVCQVWSIQLYPLPLLHVWGDKK